MHRCGAADGAGRRRTHHHFTDWVAASARPRYTGYLAYYVAKSAVKALTEALALELAADRILVNAIAPGPILAPEGITTRRLTLVARSDAAGTMGGPAEIAKMVTALVDSDFITGETIGATAVATSVTERPDMTTHDPFHPRSPSPEPRCD